MDRTGKWILFLLLNASIVIFLLIFQFLLFGLAPAVSPELPLPQRKTEVIDFVLEQDMLLLGELMVGLGVSFIINKYVFHLPIKKNIWTLGSIFIIVVSSGLFYSLNYINR